MKAITVGTEGDQFIIKIDKTEIDMKRLLEFIELLRIESMADQINFSEEIEELGKDIKKEWWKNNKDVYIPKEYQ